MHDQLFMFLGEAVANEVAGYRSGARHALMIFSAGQSLEAAVVPAGRFAQDSGWQYVELKRCEEIGDDTDLIDDDTLRQAADIAKERGQCIVVYADEIPLNA
jgi:hypothetical protein